VKRPVALWILAFWLLFLAFGGFYGGMAMLLEPSGAILQMTDLLPRLHIQNYILPGLFLLAFMGLLPLFLIYALLARPHWQWLEPIFRPVKYHWAWIGTLALGVLLAIWLALQAILIGFTAPIQFVIAFTEVFILLFALLRPVRKYYAE